MPAITDFDGPLPSYRELPYCDALKGRYCWGLFGDDDELGALNLLTPRRVKRALGLVQEGRRINLSLPLNEPDPAPPNRSTYVHHMLRTRNSLDDYLDSFYLQGSSQWDALRHARAREFGWYNGFDEHDTSLDGHRLGIDKFAQAGFVARGVLVDFEGHMARQGRRFDPLDGYAIHVEDIEATLREQQSELEPGDIFILNTGWLAAFRRSPLELRKRLIAQQLWPGLHAGEAMAEFLWDAHVAAIAGDTRAIEQAPGDPDAGFLHRRLIPMLGITMGELLDLQQITEVCRSRNRHDFLFLSIPLNLPGGVGSPANAIAVI